MDERAYGAGLDGRVGFAMLLLTVALLLCSKGATAATNKAQLKADLSKKLSSTEQSRLRELLTDAVPAYASRLLAPFVHASIVHAVIAHLLSVEDSAVEAGTGRAVMSNRCNDALRFVPMLSTANLNAAQVCKCCYFVIRVVVFCAPFA